MGELVGDFDGDNVGAKLGDFDGENVGDREGEEVVGV